MKKTIEDLLDGAFTVPNLLTVVRIILVPFFAVEYYHRNYLAAVIILAVSGLTDFLDGKIARKFNQVSALGKLLDPLADKATQITLAVLFFITFRSSDDKMIKAFSFIFLVFLIKEAVMIIGSVIMLIIGLRPGAAELPGKVATFAFYVIMILIILFGVDIGILSSIFTLPPVIMIVLVSISAVLCIVSFCGYIPGVISQYKEKKSGKNNK